MARKRNRSPLGGFEDAALGLGSLGLTTAVGAGVASRAPAGTPNLTGGFSTLAGFASVGVTAAMGRSVLDMTQDFDKKKKKGRVLGY